MEIRIFQKGFNFSQDGPGNRLVYHLQGCNMRCPWCSNPEGLDLHGGTMYSTEELMGEILRSSLMFFDGGGITLTGGEATMQFDAAGDLLKAAHSCNIRTCIETNGTHPRLPELFPYIDHLIVDVKHYDPKKHEEITGVSCETTFRNIEAAIKAGKTLALRIPLIGGFNASAEDARHFADLFRKMHTKGHATLELLCYHEYGKSKYENLNRPYLMDNTAFISDKALHAFRKILEYSGMTLIST